MERDEAVAAPASVQSSRMAGEAQERSGGPRQGNEQSPSAGVEFGSP